jgi:uncharacterized membrane protein
MDINELVGLLMRWMHILSAIALMGGTIFMRFGLHPSLATLDPQQQEQLKAAVRRHWAKWVMVTSGFLLFSGIVNIVLFTSNKEISPMPYHAIVTLKMLLALVIFFVASVLVGRSPNAEKFRAKAVFWMNLNLVLAVIVVMIGGYLRTLHHQPAADATPAPSINAASAE